MTALLLEPHNDDAVLFASWTCLRHRPHVITVLRSHVQAANGITADEREKESVNAMRILIRDEGDGAGPWWPHQWPHRDDAPDWDAIHHDLEELRRSQRGYSWEDAREYEFVFAPWPDEPGAHDHHRQIGALALEVFGPERTRFYCTYAVGGDKTRGREVPYEPAWIEKKHRALACYRSQMERGPRRLFMMDLHEYEPDL